jgi:hypothetical protein
MMYNRGFALPTVLISSIIMMMVLLSGLTALASVSAAVRIQYNDSLSKAASQAGVKLADSCIRLNGEATWTNTKPLKPNTDCSGNETLSCPTSSNDQRCYVVFSDLFRTSFSVGLTVNGSGAVGSADSQGIVYGVKTSSNQHIQLKSYVSKIDTDKLLPAVVNQDQISSSGLTEIDHSVAVSLHTDFSTQYNSYCGVRASDSNVTCRFVNGNDSAPFGTTQMKSVAVSLASTLNGTYNSYCGVRASDSNVTCRFVNGNDSAPFGTTQTRGSSTGYLYCAITLANLSMCTNIDSPQPFGSQQLRSIFINNKNVSTVCIVESSSSLGKCASLASSPFGTTKAKMVSAYSASGKSICGVYSSSETVGCVASSTSPFGSQAMKDISVSHDESSNDPEICSIYSSNSQVFCANPSSLPFSNTEVNDVSVTIPSGGTSYVCAIMANYQVQCASPTSSPFAGTSRALTLSISNGQDTVCGIMSSSSLISCLKTTDSPFDTNQIASPMIRSSTNPAVYVY